MTYWSLIFPQAMEEFKKMPDAKALRNREPKYNIRSDQTWAAVYHDRFRSKSRHVWRWTTENATETLRAGTRLVPQMDMVTPVVGAIQVILEAAKISAEVRKKSLDAFDDLDGVFSDVEVFLSTFKGEAESPGRRSTLMRGSESLRRGKDYQAEHLESLTSITSESKRLVAEAVKTHIHDFHEYSIVTKPIQQLIHRGQGDIAVAVSSVDFKMNGLSEQTPTIIDQGTQIQVTLNNMLGILSDKHDQEKRRLQQELAVAHNANKYLVGVLRSVLPLPHAQPQYQYHQYQAARQQRSSLSQDELWMLLGMPTDIDAEDMALSEARREHLTLKERARAQQIVVHCQLFQDWIVSPTSSKLLVHGDFFSRAGMLGAATLSLFCTSLAKAFRARPDYLYTSNFDDDYTDRDEEDASSGGVKNTRTRSSTAIRKDPVKRMLKSLMSQLLCDYDFGGAHANLLPPGIDQSLPATTTLFCVIDGIISYEREELEEAMLDALGDILGLTVGKNSGVAAAVKVLLTSPRPTSTVRVAFEEEEEEEEEEGGLDCSSQEVQSWILSMQSLPSLPWTPSEARLNRELGVEDC
ncbi:hypothetical protein B0H63DRAFT_546597 [Podospora didyma]|uniref:Uncharacterized protein n=1 Tax=Podospora didyma TaxID=330526 RepID=A0AAE0NI51_9PEZI|nr:hypothetical protein B0H63DRAFT_546597 [Podospora didyma]